MTPHGGEIPLLPCPGAKALQPRMQPKSQKLTASFRQKGLRRFLAIRPGCRLAESRVDGFPIGKLLVPRRLGQSSRQVERNSRPATQSATRTGSSGRAGEFEYTLAGGL